MTDKRHGESDLSVQSHGRKGHLRSPDKPHLPAGGPSAKQPNLRTAQSYPHQTQSSSLGTQSSLLIESPARPDSEPRFAPPYTPLPPREATGSRAETAGYSTSPRPSARHRQPVPAGRSDRP